jgi:hypothetical protein
MRLTDLAAKAHLSLAACSELVDELQELGYLERQPDPSDGRAKLLFPTAKGREVLDAAGLAVADLEQRWREHLPPGTFDRACHNFNDLIVAFANEDRISDLDQKVDGGAMSNACRYRVVSGCPRRKSVVRFE